MDKITQVNIEGHNYGFVAGQAVQGICGAQAADYVKTIVLPEGASLVEGMILLVTFVNNNTAGHEGAIPAYSSDGETFYYDQAMTQPITLPPVECYSMTLVSGDEYEYRAFIVWAVNGVSKPFCDSRGHPCGGGLWGAGDIVSVLVLEDKYIALQASSVTTTNEVIEGSSLPITSGGVFTALLGKLGAKLLNSYYGMTAPNNADNVWIRTTQQGIIPYQSGGRTGGHQSLGTSSWYFQSGYVQNMYVNKINLGSTAGTENGDIWLS